MVTAIFIITLLNRLKKLTTVEAFAPSFVSVALTSSAKTMIGNLSRFATESVKTLTSASLRVTEQKPVIGNTVYSVLRLVFRNVKSAEFSPILRDWIAEK